MMKKLIKKITIFLYNYGLLPFKFTNWTFKIFGLKEI